MVSKIHGPIDLHNQTEIQASFVSLFALLLLDCPKRLLPVTPASHSTPPAGTRGCRGVGIWNCGCTKPLPAYAAHTGRMCWVRRRIWGPLRQSPGLQGVVESPSYPLKCVPYIWCRGYGAVEVGLNPQIVKLYDLPTCGAGPLSQLRGELFKTFRQRRSIVSVQEYETDKEVSHPSSPDYPCTSRGCDTALRPIPGMSCAELRCSVQIQIFL